MKTILFTGGGTGGHVTKNVAIIKALQEKKKDIKIVYIGSGTEYETREIKKLNIEYKTVSTGKLRRYLSKENITDLLRFMRGLKQSLSLLKKIKPSIIFSSGGYVALPVCLAGSVRRIHIITHESDSIPGLANKIINNFAEKICITFAKSEKHLSKNKTVLTGNPIREEVLQGSADKALATNKLSKDKPTLLIMGGSQGALKINQLIEEILPELTKNIQVIHITGKDKEVAFKGPNYVQHPFVDAKALADIYQVANLVISRAGANSIAEIIASRIPNILIPLPSAASNHQAHNALEMKEKGYSVVLHENKTTPGILIQKIESLIKDGGERQSMIQAMSLVDPLAPTKKIVEILEPYLTENE